MADLFEHPPCRSRHAEGFMSSAGRKTVHAGKKDWREGGKPLCAMGGNPHGWSWLAPLSRFWQVEEQYRCQACEVVPLVAKAKPSDERSAA